MGIKNVSATMEATVCWLQLLAERRQTRRDKDSDGDGEQNWELEERNVTDKQDKWQLVVVTCVAGRKHTNKAQRGSNTCTYRLHAIPKADQIN